MKKLKPVGTIVNYNKIDSLYNKVIIGIDPGLKNLGVGILLLNNLNEIKNYHAILIKIKQERSIEQKLYFIFEQIDKIIQEFKPNIISVEDAFVGLNKNSAIKLGLTRGAILSAIGKNNINLKIISPKEIKMQIAGSGDANKESIQFYLKKNLNNYEIESLDISDALAAAFYVYENFQKEL